MQIQHYTLEGELARGGMGVVYRARDTRSGSSVVIKLLHVEGKTSRRRLEREARALKRLTHPNLVSLYDSGEHRGSPYLVLPFLPGASLQDRLDRQGPLPVEEAIEVGLQVCSGLQAAHAEGLLHRDVKPANVLFDDHFSSRVKLTDFGLVKDIGPGQSQTLSLSVGGRFLGSPGYWPPEQAFGRLGEIGPPADVYGLGALLYALIGGRPPRTGETVVQALEAFNYPVLPLGRRAPAWLDALIQRCLEHDPQQRPSLEEVFTQLRRRGLDLDRRGPGRGWTAAVVGLAAVLVVLLGALVWVLVQGGELASPGAATSPAETPPVETPPHVGSLPVETPPVEEGDPGEAMTDLEPAPPDEASQELVRLLEEAGAESEAQRFPQAVERCDRALELDPRSVSAYVIRGRAKRRMGRHAEALIDLDRAIELDPRAQDAYANRGMVLRAIGRYPEAIADYDRALELDPSDVTTLGNRGFAKAKLGEHVAALEDYDRAIRLGARSASVHLNRGRSNQALRRHAIAVEDFDRALALDPEARTAWGYRAACKIGLGRVQDALYDLDRAIELCPNDAAALANRAYCKQRLQRLADAESDLRRALELQPSNPIRHLSLGNNTLWLERDAEALEHFQRALELDPREPRAYAGRGQCLEAAGRYAEAIADYDRALELGLPTASEVRQWRARAVARRDR